VSAGAVPVLNPWAFCERCGDGVHARASGRNLPCGHAAAVGSVCASWTPDGGCRCDEALEHPEPDPVEAEAAVALQEALEAQDAIYRRGLIAAVRLVDGVDGGEAAPRPDEQRVLEQADRLRAWMRLGVFLAAMLVLMALWAAGGPW
jgi:hypothetical protein